MKNFLKENWFKLAILIILVTAAGFFIAEKLIYLKAYNYCVENIPSSKNPDFHCVRGLNGASK